MSTIDTAKDTDKGTWRKRFITRLEKIVNDDTYSGEYDEIDALEIIETAHTEKKKMILSLLKWKPENVVNVGKLKKIEYNESDDPEESDEEVIDITQDEEARNLMGDEVYIRNKLLDVLVANKDKTNNLEKFLCLQYPSITL
ncbi:16026_t:CDS:2 [Funneliformis geosporum]|nr:16026_t:CDS:2 [Funneliformis geosporum]